MQNINQISREVIKKVVHFNTKFRENYYNTPSSDFKYNFPVPINNVLSTRLRSIDVPNTWYTFSRHLGNYRFRMKVFCAGKRIVIDDEKDIEIPDGNYNVTQLTNYINKEYLYLSGDSTSFSYIKMEISDIDLRTRFLIVGEPPGTITYDVTFIYPELKVLMYGMGWFLGFRYAKYLNNEKELVSEALFDGGGDRYLYISLDDFNKSRTNNNIIFLDNGFLDKDIIGKMYLSDGKFHINVSDNDSSENLKKREFIGPVDIKRIHLKLLDEYGNAIYLNNMDFSFSLEFEILYEKYQRNYVR